MRLLPSKLRLRVAAVASVAACVALGAAGSATAAVTLDWSQANVFLFSGPPNMNKTWLGYTTSPAPPAGPGSLGTATPSAGATGPTVSPESARGADQWYTTSFPATAGAIDQDALAGTMEFEGALTFASPTPPAGHGFTISVENPIVEFNGDATGQLYASGVTSEGSGSYTDADPVFALDLSNVTWMLYADGTRQLSGIAPAIATAGLVFPSGSYGTGAGPDRIPNTFGTFALTFAPNTGPTGPTGPSGPTGPAGPTGKDGRTVRIVQRIQLTRLARAPFGKKTRRVRVMRRGKVMARGAIRGRKLRVKLTKRGGKQLKGRYVIRTARGKGRAVVRLG